MMKLDLAQAFDTLSHQAAKRYGGFCCKPRHPEKHCFCGSSPNRPRYRCNLALITGVVNLVFPDQKFMSTIHQAS